MNLAVFSGQYFWKDGEKYSTDEAFVKFVTSFKTHFEKIHFVDAIRPENGRKPYVLDPSFADVVGLPDVELCAFRRNVVTALPQIYGIIMKHLHQWDVVWLHNPHPIGLLFANICRKVRKPHFQFIRQDLPAYVSYRNRGLRRVPAVAVAWLLECWCQQLSKRTLTFAVGEAMYGKYKRRGGPVHPTSVSLVSDIHIIDERQVLSSDGKEKKVKLLSVGRLAPEKGLEYLVEAVGEMTGKKKQQIVLNIVGEGPEEEKLRMLVHEKGLQHDIRFLGHIPHGPRLFDLYRRSDIYIHSSLTEGWPQTLLEAMASGTPIVATAVGGIPHAVAHGQNGLLIRPKSSRAICQAIERLMNDETLKKQLICSGLVTAKSHTTEIERERIFRTLQPYLQQVQK
jgi:glycosyltransferase involved in cell wall biosynthesis